MSTLIVIGYGNETSAAAASEEALRRAGELELEPDGVAVVVRDHRGAYQITTNHQDLDLGAPWSAFWRLVCELLFLGRAASAGADAGFGAEVQALVEPRTSALFVVLPPGVTPVALRDALARFGGTLLTSSLTWAPRPPAPRKGGTVSARRARAPVTG